MGHGIAQWTCVFLSASALVIAGCASSDAGSEDVQVVPDDNAHARPGNGAADTGASEKEALVFGEADQALQQGPAPLMAPGLTILGNGLYGSNNESDWTLDTGSGLRVWTRYVSFPSGSFSSEPTVIVSLSQFYGGNGTNKTYVNTYAEDVSESGFNLKFATTGSTSISSATARWIAFGPN